MPPPKAKLHKTSGKSRSGPPKLSQTYETTQNAPEPSPSSSNAPSNSSLSAEQEEQFQIELYWCIQQLQTALSTGKLPNKQVQEHTKALNTLMSTSAPMVKKRQVMRLSFGDYRAKMTDEERKIKKLSIKIGAGHPSDKSMFLRKAIASTAGNDFKFNFPTPEQDDSEEHKAEMVTEGTSSSTQTPKKSIFSKSNNSFKFNFSPNEWESSENS